MQLFDRLEGRALFANFTATSTADLIADINAANATAAADTITLRAGAVYTLTAVNNTGDGPTGLPSITRPLTIVGNGAVVERGAAAGTPAFRLFDVNAGADLTLRDVTLRNGRAAGFSSASTTWYKQPTTTVVGPQPHGGAVFNQGALTLDRVTLDGNTAAGSNGFVAREPSVVRRYASGSGKGGAVYSSGALTVTASTFHNNAAIGGSAPGDVGVGSGVGGAVYVAGGTASITGASITGNRAAGGDNLSTGGTASTTGGFGAGGGLAVAGGTVTVKGGTLTSNTARGGNGGKGAPHYALPYGLGAGGAALGSGGGAYATGGTLTLRDASLTTNAAAGGAGFVISFPDGTAYRGRAGQGVGGGLYVATFSPSPSVGLDPFTRSNVKLNTASSSAADIYGPYAIVA